MDEPSPCLLRSFSHPSDSTEGHIAHALGGSISFGRFMSETLDWVKFSTFSQNRYLEEAEKCLKPGLVAQKKAYFEDYFKNTAARKAAASVKEATTETSNIAEKPLTDIDFANGKLHLPVYMEPKIDTFATSSTSSLDASGCDFIVKDNESENGRLKSLEIVEEQQMCVESSNELGNVDVREGNVLAKESDNEDTEASANKKKLRVPSPNSSMHNRVPKIPLPPAIKTTLRPSTIGSKAATDIKKAVGHSTARKRLAPTSLHTSINFSSSISKTSAMLSPRHQQVRSSKVHAPSCKKRPDTSQTSIRASSIGGTFKESSTTSPTLNEASVCKTSNDRSKPSRILKRASDHEASKDGSKTLRASVCGTSRDNSNALRPLRASVKSKALQTLNMASLSIASKRPSVTTKSEERRTTQLNKLVSKTTTCTSVSKWYSQSVDHSKPMNAGGNKSGSTNTKTIPFNFRSDERAAKRKKFFEKIEEKSDAREAEKEQLRTGSKRKTEDSWAKLWQSTYTGLRTNLNVAPHVPLSPNNHLKKPRSPKLGQRHAPSFQDKSARTAVKSSISGSHNSSKHALEMGLKTTSLPKKNASENASPNIQK